MSLPINIVSVAPSAKAPVESPRAQGAVDEAAGSAFKQELSSRVDARARGDGAGQAASGEQEQAKSAPNEGAGADAAILAMLGLVPAVQPAPTVVVPMSVPPVIEDGAEATPVLMAAPAALTVTTEHPLAVTVSPLEAGASAAKEKSSEGLSALLAPAFAGHGNGGLIAEAAAGVTGAVTANLAAGLDEELPDGTSPAGAATGFAEMLAGASGAQKSEAGESAHAPLKPGQVNHLAEPVGSKGWGDALAQRVGMMLGRKEQQIDMQLNPPHLGPMEVKLTLGNEQASVVFTSQHAAVREALAAATPRLTALLADQGIQLTDVQVASDSLQQHQQQAAQQQAQSNQGGAPRSGGTFAERDGVAGNHTLPVIGELRVPVARSGVSFYA
ncbi:flagellar hook-length control protein FliK [Chitinilyticum piscinae]|uniref:Flagellar hook-length control protein FliK n=1 Tax=Chitinilyticum piscinae TaxID=2866724 RepID=A0A8J7FLC2_9NEIS|nr:flagellar hook-length control protein FliK [Chitinilyticum piscinae]MBE9609957.1 flagellar hook-length control protein FliK [Chitinilyticum piscinae]